LRFKLSTGEEVFKTIESDDQVPAEIDAFRNHQGEYGAISSRLTTGFGSCASL